MSTDSNKPKIEVLTSVERRRRWSPAKKKAIVQETYEAGETVSSVARQCVIQLSQLFYWRRRMEEGALAGVGSEEKVIPESEVKGLRERIKRLEQVLGRKTEENEILKEAVRPAREKKLISQSPLRRVEGFE